MVALFSGLMSGRLLKYEKHSQNVYKEAEENMKINLKLLLYFHALIERLNDVMSLSEANPTVNDQ